MIIHLYRHPNSNDCWVSECKLTFPDAIVSGRAETTTCSECIKVRMQDMRYRIGQSERATTALEKTHVTLANRDVYLHTNHVLHIKAAFTRNAWEAKCGVRSIEEAKFADVEDATCHVCLKAIERDTEQSIKGANRELTDGQELLMKTRSRMGELEIL
jgi:hypothetical protein